MADEQPRERWTAPEAWPEEPANLEPSGGNESDREQQNPSASPLPSSEDPAAYSSDSGLAQPAAESGLFQQFEAAPPPARIPNFGHLGILVALLLLALLCTGILMELAMRHQMFGVSSAQKALSDIHYMLGSEAILYVFTLIAAALIFPMIWHKGFLAGLQWNAATAIRLRWRLVSAAVACLLLAMISSIISPGPENAPIDKIFRAPGAAWLLFAFGITFAPFFEEMFFRGFLLPALCTAVDWSAEKIVHQPRRPLGPNGHPEWSLTAMAVGAVITSLPFALMHAEQTGYSKGPLVLLVGVSLVLCAVRLSTRSLASSVVVHACYNFTLFSIMMVGTHGFRHLDKM